MESDPASVQLKLNLIPRLLNRTSGVPKIGNHQCDGIARPIKPIFSSISDQFGTVLPPHLGLHHKLEERITESPAELTYVLDGLNKANRPDATADSKFLKVLAQVF
jgi:hypothetical protein